MIKDWDPALSGAQPEEEDTMSQFSDKEINLSLTHFDIQRFRLGESVTFFSNGHEVEVTFSEESGVMVSVDGKTIVTTCTDEREILQAVDAQGQLLDEEKIVYIRIPGAVFGLHNAINDLKKDEPVSSTQLIAALNQAGVTAANHRDDHHDDLQGCGYAGLAAMNEAEEVFGEGRRINSVNELMAEYQRNGVADILLTQGHVAGGFVINLSEGLALDPTSENAQNSFFSLDLGVTSQVLGRISGELVLDNEQQRQVLENITYDNMAAVYVLSNGAVKTFHVLESEDSRLNEYLNGIVEAAQQRMQENLSALDEMIEVRSHAAQH